MRAHGRRTPPPDPRLPPAALRWLQIAWLVLFLTTVSLYLVGLSVSWRGPRSLCLAEAAGCTEAAASAELTRFGLPPEAAVDLAIGLRDIAAPVGCLLIAAFIFWRRPDRAITLAVSGMLAIYGPAVNTGLVDAGLQPAQAELWLKPPAKRSRG